MTATITTAETRILAQTIWGENRGGGYLGMQSVCNAIMNRVKIGGWWGSTVMGVCLKPYQFSCWLRSDPNFPKLESITMTDADFVMAVNIAKEAIASTLEDVTGGADSYYSLSMATPPDWSATAKYTVTVAGQKFYKTT